MCKQVEFSFIFACVFIIGKAKAGNDALRFEISLGPEADEAWGVLTGKVISRIVLKERITPCFVEYVFD
jgi:hypothetical protein